MSSGQRILLLMGYDYINALGSLVKDKNIYTLITQNNTQYFSSDNLNKLKELMGERLTISSEPDKDVSSLIETGNFHTVLTLGWRKLIDVDLFSEVPHLINVHPALLPEYKGYHPVPYVLLNNEKHHGITAHLITPEMDAGDIVLRRKFSINQFSTLPSLQYLVNKEMPGFLNELFTLILSGNTKTIENKDSETVIRAPKRKPEDSELMLEDSVELMFRKVKASDPERFPAFFFINGEKVYVHLYRDPEAERQTKFDI